MPKGRDGLTMVLMVVVLAACSPPPEKGASASGPTPEGPDTTGARHVEFEPGATVMVLPWTRRKPVDTEQAAGARDDAGRGLGTPQPSSGGA